MLKEKDLKAGGDYSYCDLRGLDLRGLDLRGCNFDCANMRGVKIDKSTKLEGVSMRYTHLIDVELEEGVLEKLNLSGYIIKGSKEIKGSREGGIKVEEGLLELLERVGEAYTDEIEKRNRRVYIKRKGEGEVELSSLEQGKNITLSIEIEGKRKEEQVFKNIEEWKKEIEESGVGVEEVEGVETDLLKLTEKAFRVKRGVLKLKESELKKVLDLVTYTKKEKPKKIKLTIIPRATKGKSYLQVSYIDSKVISKCELELENPDRLCTTLRFDYTDIYTLNRLLKVREEEVELEFYDEGVKILKDYKGYKERIGLALDETRPIISTEYENLYKNKEGGIEIEVERKEFLKDLKELREKKSKGILIGVNGGEVKLYQLEGEDKRKYKREKEIKAEVREEYGSEDTARLRHINLNLLTKVISKVKSKTVKIRLEGGSADQIKVISERENFISIMLPLSRISEKELMYYEERLEKEERDLKLKELHGLSLGVGLRDKIVKELTGLVEVDVLEEIREASASEEGIKILQRGIEELSKEGDRYLGRAIREVQYEGRLGSSKNLTKEEFKEWEKEIEQIEKAEGLSKEKLMGRPNEYEELRKEVGYRKMERVLLGVEYLEEIIKYKSEKLGNKEIEIVKGGKKDRNYYYIEKKVIKGKEEKEVGKVKARDFWKGDIVKIKEE